MSSLIYIKCFLLNQSTKVSIENSSSYFIYQFKIKNNDDLYSIINIFSKQNMNLELNKEVDLPVSVSLFNGQITYEFKRS